MDNLSPLESLPAEIIDLVADWIRAFEYSEFRREDICSCAFAVDHGHDYIVLSYRSVQMELPRPPGMYSFASTNQHLRAAIVGNGPASLLMDGYRTRLQRHYE
jgi:hypothetical protein